MTEYRQRMFQKADLYSNMEKLPSLLRMEGFLGAIHWTSSDRGYFKRILSFYFRKKNAGVRENLPPRHQKVYYGVKFSFINKISFGKAGCNLKVLSGGFYPQKFIQKLNLWIKNPFHVLLWTEGPSQSSLWKIEFLKALYGPLIYIEGPSNGFLLMEDP